MDIGIASVGWAVLGENRIIDLGVRCFDKAETADKGESLNLARRAARLLRRRLRRRAWRLTKLARLLKREGVISDVDLFKQSPTKGTPAVLPWQLRVEAIDRKLEAEEWARVLYHLCKHRGFHWMSKAEEKKADEDKEGGAVKKGLAGTKRLMQEKNYRAAAEMVLGEFAKQATDKDGNPKYDKLGKPIFAGSARNKRGDYSKALSRALLADELSELFARQRQFGNPHAGEHLAAVILGNGDKKSGLFWAQKPALSGEALLKMLGKCTFEKSEYRAPKASFTAERHVWLTRLTNLRIVVDGKTRPLTDAERRIARPLPYETGELKYTKLRKALTKAGLSDEFRFVGLAYPSERQRTEEKAKDPEDEKLVKLPGWQELRKTLKDAGLETEWQKISTAALDGKPQLLDEIARVLSVYKEDEEVKRELGRLDLPNKSRMVEALLTTRFDKFSNLSLKALYNILPHMEAGLRYDEACVQAGYHHSQLLTNTDIKEQYLPPLYEQHRGKDRHNKNKMLFSERIEREIQGGIPRNPVVLRALNQARKVVNALIKIYGSPHEVHIEMARDLSRPLEERKKIKDAQEEFRERNDKDRELFIEQFGRRPKDNEYEKFRLYREQQGKSIYPSMSEKQGICAYSFDPIDIERLLEPGYVEIDHALPYQRSFDDSKNNRVLVLARENRNKSDMTPFEYLDGKENSDRWRQFEIFVNSNKIYRQAKRNRLLKKDFGDKEAEAFRERNLNDTRYICRFFKNYIERYLQLAAASNSRRCVVVSGSLTSLLRARWGLLKARGDSDRHHALDAVVVAACGHQVVKRLSSFVRAEGWAHRPDMGGYLNVETGELITTQEFVRKDEIYKLFPRPWPHFRTELESRLKIDDPTMLRAEINQLGSYPSEALNTLHSLFVSRAPQRRKGGEIHEGTIRSSKEILDSVSHVKVPLQKLKLATLCDIVGATYSRNAPLIALLRERLEKHDNDGTKAFADPVYKPSKKGNGSLVKTVKLASTQKNGMFVRGGIAELGEMHHVDVYLHDGRFLIEPAYAARHDKRLKSGNLPENAEFLFSLGKNDYVKITLGNTSSEGYFVMYESDGRLTLRAHDQPKPDKTYFRKSVASATSIEKFHIDVLGNIYPAPPEQRRDLA